MRAGSEEPAGAPASQDDRTLAHGPFVSPPGYCRRMARDQVDLRRIESTDELAPATALAREFGDWATERLRVELGIVIPAEADHPTEVLDELRESGGRLYVAEVDGGAVGIGGLKLLSDTVGEIKRMLVRPSAQGLGVGRAIVRRLIDDARALGCATIYLESASFMHPAHALYRSVGFVLSDSYAGREFEGAAHDVSVFMRLDLTERAGSAAAAPDLCGRGTRQPGVVLHPRAESAAKRSGAGEAATSPAAGRSPSAAPRSSPRRSRGSSGRGRGVRSGTRP